MYSARMEIIVSQVGVPQDLVARPPAFACSGWLDLRSLAMDWIQVTIHSNPRTTLIRQENARL
jgi:hypothetical protein